MREKSCDWNNEGNVFPPAERHVLVLLIIYYVINFCVPPTVYLCVLYIGQWINNYKQGYVRSTAMGSIDLGDRRLARATVRPIWLLKAYMTS